ncbi:hypothetical protein Anas_08555 [Armadillidium nasatum]|uniref:Uncharacterized protein n=1 Tax=Armadillidium nasatum TaxID=96803 RepID=A0A5N5SM85_9CRUS|nr:hypothetical protein Anas_08555 [Armadillidium nasatum]
MPKFPYTPKIGIPMPKFFKTNFNLLLTCNSILEVSNFIRKESLCRFSTFSSFNYKTSILKNYVKPQTNCSYTVSLTKPSSGQNYIVKGKEGDSILDVVKNNDLDIPGFVFQSQLNFYFINLSQFIWLHNSF